MRVITHFLFTEESLPHFDEHGEMHGEWFFNKSIAGSRDDAGMFYVCIADQEFYCATLTALLDRLNGLVDDHFFDVAIYMFDMFGFMSTQRMMAMLGRKGYGFRRVMSGESPCETIEVYQDI